MRATACWMRRCHECGFPLGKKDVFCPRCGAKQRREKVNPAIMARTATVIMHPHFTRAAANP